MAPDIGERNPTNEQRRKRHTMAFARSHVTRHKTIAPKPKAWQSVWGRAIAWLLPWGVEEYPGVRRGVEELLAGRAGWDAFKAWRAEKRTAPQWFALVLADMIEARCRAGLAIVTELRDYRVPVQRNRGAMAVQADGRDRRGGRIGNRRGHDPDNRPRAGKPQSSDTPSDFD